MSTPAFEDALRVELDRLTNQRSLIDARMELIRRLLAGPDDLSTFQIAPSLGVPDASIIGRGRLVGTGPYAGISLNPHDARRTPDDQMPGFVFDGAGFQKKTVKELVKDVLRERPGSKAARVTQTFRARGVRFGGETRLSHRVYNEIWRMVKSGEVEKLDDGGFQLTAKGEQS